MIIESVVKRKSGTITIHYTKGGKHYGLTLTPHEIVENYEATQQGIQQTKGHEEDITADDEAPFFQEEHR